MKDFVDTAAKAIGIGTAAALCFAFIYNVSFFIATVGAVNMQHLTITDHITVAIRELPKIALLLAIAGIVIGFLFARQRKALAPGAKIEGLRARSRNLSIALLGFLAVALALSIWFEDWAYTVGAFLALVYLAGAGCSFLHFPTTRI